MPLFQDCEDAFISQLVMRLKLGVFLPSEVIFKIGDVGHEMYFITKVRCVICDGTCEHKGRCHDVMCHALHDQSAVTEVWFGVALHGPSLCT